MWGISISASYFILVALRQDSHSLLRKLLFSYAPSCFYLLDWMGFGFVCGSRDCRGPRRQRQHRCQFPVTVHPPCGDLNPFSEPEPDSPYVVRPWSMRRYRRGRRTERRGEDWSNGEREKRRYRLLQQPQRRAAAVAARVDHCRFRWRDRPRVDAAAVQRGAQCPDSYNSLMKFW